MELKDLSYDDLLDEKQKRELEAKLLLQSQISLVSVWNELNAYFKLKNDTQDKKSNLAMNELNDIEAELDRRSRKIKRKVDKNDL